MSKKGDALLQGIVEADETLSVFGRSLSTSPFTCSNQQLYE